MSADQGEVMMRFERLEERQLLVADAMADLVVLRGAELQILEGRSDSFAIADTVRFSNAPHHLSLADMTGDGTPEVVAQVSGEWLIVDPTSSDDPVRFGEWIDVDWQDIHIGDFTGNGRNDVVGRTSDYEWWMLRNDGPGEGVETFLGRWNPDADWRDTLFADFNGDGRTDILSRANGDWWLAAGNAEGVDAQLLHGRWSPLDWQDVLVGQFAGDARPDLIGRAPDGNWWIQETVDGGSRSSLIQRWSTNVTWRDTVAIDLDGDGMDDLASRTEERGEWWTLDVNADVGVNSFWTRWNRGLRWDDVVINDFNEDGAADLLGFAEQGWHLSVQNGASVGAWFDPNDPGIDMAISGLLDTETDSIIAKSIAATLRPTSDPLEVSLNADSNFVVSGNGQELVAINFQSPEGRLVTGSDPAPFGFFLTESETGIAVGSISGAVQVLGSITLDFGWDPLAATDDLIVTYGIDGSTRERTATLVGERFEADDA